MQIDNSSLIGMDSDFEQRFAQELLINSCAVPDFLLCSYQQLGLDAEDLVWIIRSMGLYNKQRKLTLRFLAETFGNPLSFVNGKVDLLVKKNILSYDKGSGQIDFMPLFKALFHLWVYARINSLEQDCKEQEVVLDADSADSVVQDLCKCFEIEFGGGISSNQQGQIEKWLTEDGFSSDLIKEALLRAVLIGKRNILYINGILRDWKANNIKTVRDAREYSEAWSLGNADRNHTSAKGKRSANIRKSVKPDKSASDMKRFFDSGDYSDD